MSALDLTTAGSRRRKPWPSAFTLTEIIVVVFLASLIMGASLFLWRRTGTTVQKGSAMIDMQQTLRAISGSLRSDVRTMVSLEECGPGRLALTALRGGRPVAITYSLDATRGTISRSEAGGPRKMFQPTGLVAAIRFSALPSVHEARTVVMALDLVARPTGSKAPASELTIVDQFTTRSLEAPFEHVP